MKNGKGEVKIKQKWVKHHLGPRLNQIGIAQRS